MKYVVPNKSTGSTRELDRALALARPASPENPGGDSILIEEGEHETRGAWAFTDQGYKMAFGGVPIESKGTVRMAPNSTRVTSGAGGSVVTRPDRDLWFTFGAGTRLYGGVWDLNWRAFDGPLPWYCCGLRFVEGGSNDVEGITVRGLRGTYSGRNSGAKNDAVEAFALSCAGKAGAMKWSKVRVEDACPDSYVSGIFPGAGTDANGIPLTIDPGARIVVSDCDVDLGRDNWFAYSANVAPADASMIPVEFVRCKGSGVQRGFHNDTGPTHAILREVSLKFTWSGVSLAAGDPGTQRILILDRCDLTGDCGIDLVGDAQQTVVAIGTRFSGSRFGSLMSPNSRILVIDPAEGTPGNASFQAVRLGDARLTLNDRRMTLARRTKS